MAHEFPKSNWMPAPFLALLGAIVLAAALFLVIPLTQTMAFDRPVELTVREVNLAAPPPPRTPPLPEEEFKPVKTPTLKPPELRSEPEQLDMKTLEMDLNPGLGASLSMGVQRMGFEAEVNVVADIRSVFKFDELTVKPTLINAATVGRALRFPLELQRRGVRKARVVFNFSIDASGAVQIRQVVSTSHDHPALERAARRAFSLARFTVTKVDGRPVSVTDVVMPLAMNAPR